MHNHDWLERARAAALKPLGALLKGSSKGDDVLYAAGPIKRWEFICHLDLPEEDVEQMLCSAAFGRNPLSAWKHLPGTGTDESGSWAWWGHPPGAGPNDTQRWVPDRLSPMQLHVHLFEVDGDPGTTAVFGHWEPSWITRPLAHYLGARTLGQRRTPPGYKNDHRNGFFALVGTSGDGSAVMWGGESVLLTADAGEFWKDHDL